jgi:3-deoxy-D-manno-octulosonate 8-phosphate phosphatase (KDO 8-P phosphatase)
MIAPRTPPDQIRLLVMDVDGVLTRGEIVYDSEGRELKSFSVRDGFGLSLWHASGYSSAVITARGGAAVERRCAELGIRHAFEGASDKALALRELAEETGIDPLAMAYIGDDWKDIPALNLVGFPAAPADAETPVLESCAWVSRRRGGEGAVRELIEHLLAAQGALTGLLRAHGYDRA